VNDRSRKQLTALARVDGVLREARLEYWLFGGWAVDFHARLVTRDHDDLDIAVWLPDVDWIAELLEAEGWHHAPNADEDGGTGYERDGVRLELTYLVRADDGSVFTPLRDGRGSWSDEALGSDVIELSGTLSRVVALTSLTRSKSSPRTDPEDAAKDRADYRALRQIGGNRDAHST